MSEPPRADPDPPAVTDALRAADDIGGRAQVIAAGRPGSAWGGGAQGHTNRYRHASQDSQEVSILSGC
eukprot:8798639-Pyramimonas_sp.AAC.1